MLFFFIFAPYQLIVPEMLLENNHDFVIELFEKYKNDFVPFDYKELLPQLKEILENSILLNQYVEYQFLEFSKVAVFAETHLFAIEVFYYVYSGKRRFFESEYQIFGVKYLESSYGQLLIRPETFGDKVSDLFVHQDNDFRNFPEFSSKYFFIADHPGNAEMFAKSNRLILLEKYDDLLLEVSGNKMIIKFSKPLNEADFHSMIQILKEF